MDSTASLNSSLYSTPIRASKGDRHEKSSFQSTNENSNSAHSPTHNHPLSLPSINLMAAFDASKQSICHSFGSPQESSTVTDRYIPSRKLLKRDSMFNQDDSEMDEENENAKQEGLGNKLINLYKRYVMEESPQRKEQTLIESYENNNILKFTNKPNHLNELQSLQKNTYCQFAEDTENALKKRKINKLPIKVLDAPALQDDYYLNLIDWSSQNFLAVGLSSSVYLWNAANSKVNKLCDLGVSNSTTSVAWSLKGPHFSLGTNNGDVQIWDIVKTKKDIQIELEPLLQYRLTDSYHFANILQQGDII